MSIFRTYFAREKMTCDLVQAIAHFQKEWKLGTRMGARLVMGSFGGHEVENKCACFPQTIP